MLRKLNCTLGIMVLIGALICGGYYVYKTKIANVNESNVYTTIKEAIE